MRLLTRAVFKEVSSAALLGTLLFTFVLFMQRLGSGKIFEILLRGSASPETVVSLLAMLLPFALIFSIPAGTLVGVLIGLGRMSGDGEVTAMRAAGVPSRRVVFPVLVYALLAMIVTGTCSLYLQPLVMRRMAQIQSQLLTQQLTAEVQPRVFEEQFTKSNSILYVGDVRTTASTTAEWHNVFIADLTPPEERTGGEYGEAPLITIASHAFAVPDPARSSIQLSTRNVFTHKVDKNPSIYISTEAPEGEQILAAKPRNVESGKSFVAMDTVPLIEEAKKSVEASVELHQRLALPIACVLLALVGVPLGVSTRKSGKSGAFVITVFLAFLYYMSLISLIGMARQGRLPVERAVWSPNLAFAFLGALLMVSLDRPGDRDLLSRLRQTWHSAWYWLRSKFTESNGRSSRLRSLPKIPLLPGVIDTYVLSSFLFYFGVLLGSFVLLAHVFFFFELLSDIFARGISMNRVVNYHFYLTPKLIYESTPMAVLVAVLVTFGILTKNNEVTAMKASGVSLYRLSVPILAACLCISGLLFAFDHYYIPDCNRIQDGIRNEIKGRPAQTWLRPDRKWIFGQGSRIYYYKYFDAAEKLMAGVNVYELDPDTFRLRRHINAESARWEPTVNAWIFQNGWVKDIDTRNFERFQAHTFPELTEPPRHFLQEMRHAMQLNFQDLANYIRELSQSGIDTVKLNVQLHKKFSVPLFALIMALLSVPFAFLTGNRGAMAGIGVSFSVAIAYLAIGRLFEEIGNVNQLPAQVAAWAPDAVFAVAGMYLFTRMRS